MDQELQAPPITGLEPSAREDAPAFVQANGGPKTPEGKARSSQNARKHGLWSELALLPHESPEAWEELRAGIFQEFAPEGTFETQLVSRLAYLMWRLSRVSEYDQQQEAEADEDTYYTVIEPRLR